MEPARDLLSRPLPPLIFIGGTQNPSISSEWISCEFLHPWPMFREVILAASAGLDLDDFVSLTDAPENERFLVGNELGLTSRFNRNVCDAVSKALSVSNQQNACFGDLHSVNPVSQQRCPDVAALYFLNPSSPTQAEGRPIAVGELKTFWTFPLELYPVTSSVPERRALEHPIGQLVSYMRAASLKHGFLSTYKTTVFVRRTDNYRFELSPPLDESSVNPSIRECFAGLCALAASNRTFVELDFDPAVLRAPSLRSFQASTRESPYRHFAIASQQAASLSAAISRQTRRNGTMAQHDGDRVCDITDLGIKSNAIIFGSNDVGRSHVKIVQHLSGSPLSKAVMEAEYDGVKAIAKCWTEEYYDNYAQEAWVYDHLRQQKPEGSPFFPSVLAYGDIVCSSVFPAGYVLIITFMEGEQLSSIWDHITLSEKQDIHLQCQRAVSILRSFRVYVRDSGKHNVLYSRQFKKATLVDFESVGQCGEQDAHNLHAPELLAIFGREIGG